MPNVADSEQERLRGDHPYRIGPELPCLTPIGDFTYSDVYPYDSITFTRAETTAAKKSKIGFHGGADVACFFSRQLGVGGTIQISSASIDVPSVRERRRA